MEKWERGRWALWVFVLVCRVLYIISIMRDILSSAAAWSRIGSWAAGESRHAHRPVMWNSVVPAAQ